MPWPPPARSDDAPFLAWVFTILRNLWFDRLRRKQTEGVPMDIDDMAELPAPGGEEDRVDTRRTLERVQRAIDRLPDAQRELMLLVCVEELSYKEAAAVTGVPIGTVMSRLARAAARGAARRARRRQRPDGGAPMNTSTDRASAPPDDAHLMAYADGALPPAEAAAVAAALERDAALAQRVALLGRTRRLAREALDLQLDAPVPPALRAAVEAMAAAQRRPAALEPTGVPRQARRPSWMQWLRDGWANLALPAAVAASVLVGVIAHRIGSAPDNGTPATTMVLAVGERVRPELAGLLDRLPSGGQAMAERLPVAMVASFRDAAGTLCRDFSLEPAPAPRVEAVACRSAPGQWELRFASVSADAAGGFAPAGSTSALDAYLASIGAVQPLDAAAEQAALAGR